MPYDQELAGRIAEMLMFEPDVSEKEMFGGLAFLVGGHMAVSVSRSGGLLLRVEPDGTEAILARPHTAPFVMRERELRGWVRVTDDGVQTREQLAEWVALGLDFARSLPAKSLSEG